MVVVVVMVVVGVGCAGGGGTDASTTHEQTRTDDLENSFQFCYTLEQICALITVRMHSNRVLFFSQC